MVRALGKMWGAQISWNGVSLGPAQVQKKPGNSDSLKE